MGVTKTVIRLTSILAAAASDEFAMEQNGEGVFTSNLIKFINGEKK